MNEVRFVFDDYDKEFENEIRKQLTPFCDEIMTIDEHGDAGSTITIICTIAQTIIAVPACILAIKELVDWKNKHEKKTNCTNDQTDKNDNTKGTDSTSQSEAEKAQPSWTMIIDGHYFDFSGLPTDYERSKAFNKVYELFPSIVGNSSATGEQKRNESK